jgi:hypothetical protein
VCNRTALIQVKDIEDAIYFFRHRNPLNVQHLLNEAHKMMQTTPSDIDPCKILHGFDALPKQTYPVFNKRPRFISDYQIIEKTKILQQEIDYLKEREVQLEAHKLAEGRKLENELMLKQLMWEKGQQQSSNKFYKETVEEYERRQMKLEQENLRLTNVNFDPNVNKNLKISVSGEPLVSVDKQGNKIINRMKKVNEDFPVIQSKLNNQKNIGKKAMTSFMNEILNHEEEEIIDDLTNELDLINENSMKEIKNEIIENRAQALLSSNDPNLLSKLQNEQSNCSICKNLFSSSKF